MSRCLYVLAECMSRGYEELGGRSGARKTPVTDMNENQQENLEIMRERKIDRRGHTDREIARQGGREGGRES